MATGPSSSFDKKVKSTSVLSNYRERRVRISLILTCFNQVKIHKYESCLIQRTTARLNKTSRQRTYRPRYWEIMYTSGQQQSHTLHAVYELPLLTWAPIMPLCTFSPMSLSTLNIPFRIFRLDWSNVSSHLVYTIPPATLLTIVYLPLLTSRDLYKIGFLLTVGAVNHKQDVLTEPDRCGCHHSMGFLPHPHSSVDLSKRCCSWSDVVQNSD